MLRRSCGPGHSRSRLVPPFEAGEIGSGCWACSGCLVDGDCRVVAEFERAALADFVA